MSRLTKWMGRFKTNLIAIRLALGDNRVPWYSKAFSILGILYAFSPVDFVADFVPLAGQLDDLGVSGFLLGMGFASIPPAVRHELVARARTKKMKIVLIALIALLVIWLAVFLLAASILKNLW